MLDQADKLRQLVRESVKDNAALEPGVPLVTVSGARDGVGASVVALRLAEELVQLGKRIVLVDANLLHPTLAGLLQVNAHTGIAEVLCGSRSAAEVLEPIGSGLHLLPGTASGNPPEMNLRALRRLLTELRALRNYADLIVLDAGCGMSPWVERMWTAALHILLVSSPEAGSLRDAYTTVKMAPWGDVDGKLRLVVNQCDDATLANRVGEGFSSTCRQFLQMKLVGTAAQISSDSSLTESGRNHSGTSHRQSVRLLAADVLSQACVFSHRIQGTPSHYGAASQAASLLSEVPTTGDVH